MPGLQDRAAVKLAEVDAKIADLTTIRTALATAVAAGCDDLTVCASSACCSIDGQMGECGLHLPELRGCRTPARAGTGGYSLRGTDLTAAQLPVEIGGLTRPPGW
nr:hypothetical protein [Parafrankia discariae]